MRLHRRPVCGTALLALAALGGLALVHPEDVAGHAVALPAASVVAPAPVQVVRAPVAVAAPAARPAAPVAAHRSAPAAARRPPGTGARPGTGAGRPAAGRPGADADRERARRAGGRGGGAGRPSRSGVRRGRGPRRRGAARRVGPGDAPSSGPRLYVDPGVPPLLPGGPHAVRHVRRPPRRRVRGRRPWPGSGAVRQPARGARLQPRPDAGALGEEPTLAALGSGSSVVYSFKADPAEVATGAYDERVRSFLAGRPAGVQA